MPTVPLASAFSGTAHDYAAYRPAYPQDLLARLRAAAATTGAAGWQVAEYQISVERVWTTDTLVGFMRSTSFASRAALRERAAPFEAELRRELLALAPNDQFPASQRFGFTLAPRKAR